MAKFYWILCCSILLAGVCIAVLSVEYPSLGSDSGEMPLAFGAGVDIAVLGTVGFFAGLLAKGASMLLKKWKK